MEELADSIGKLSMNAKEWRPQQPDAPTLQQQYQTSRTSSLPALPARLPSSSSFNAPRSPLPPHHQQQQMDQRHYSVGGMWQQPQQQQQQQPLAQSPPTQSDLTAVSVNEFVPGRGWSSGSTSSAGIPQSQYSSNSNSLDVPSSWRGASSSSLKPSSGDSTTRQSFGQEQQQQQPYSPYKQQHASILPLRQPDNTSGGYVEDDDEVDDGNDHHHSQQFLPNVATLPSGPSSAPPFRSLHTMALSDDLWRYHRDLALEASRQMDPSDPRHKAVPPPFVNAYCLDPPLLLSGGQSSTRSSFGYPSTTFQVTSGEDGYLYCLRRFDNVRSVSSKIAVAVTERWTTSCTTTTTLASPVAAATNHGNGAVPSNHHLHNINTASTGNSSGGGGTLVVQHPGVVRFYRCFCAQRAVFFVHDYISGARTLRERTSRGVGGSSIAASVPEPLLWSAVSQLVSALRAIHSAKLAVRCLTAQHVLFTMTTTPELGKGRQQQPQQQWRLFINCVGVVDALEFEARKNVIDLQRDDVRDLGRLILTLGTGTEITKSSDAETLQACEMYLAQHYSRDLHSLAVTLIRSANPPTIMDVCRAMAGRIFDELDSAHMAYDRCEQALASEYDSGRALRLLLKLGFINERPEFGMNRRWAQSGDCYVLTLFRDYVFHQADGAGNPVMDLGHVITALNKLDAADEEKIVLASRDGKTLLVVTYADVARCLDNAFLELCAGAVPPALLQY